MSFLADPMAQTKTPTLTGGCYCLVPEAGLTQSILLMLFGVSPRLRRPNCSRNWSNRMPFLADPMAQTKTPTLTGGCYCLVPEAGLEPARF